MNDMPYKVHKRRWYLNKAITSIVVITILMSDIYMFAKSLESSNLYGNNGTMSFIELRGQGGEEGGLLKITESCQVDHIYLWQINI